jgi:beta-ureidopropionase
VKSINSVNVISVGMPLAGESPDHVEHQTRRMERVLEALRPYRPDFVCFSEICLHLGSPLRKAITDAQPVPGPAIERLAPWCRRLDSHLLVPLLESADGRVFNTVVLLDPAGAIKGRYRKHVPTSYEMADGISPGTDVPVWQTCHGRVGAAICFDLKFPEVALALARGCARLVFWPTMFQGGRRLESWARDYGFHIASCGVWGGQVIDPHGQVLAESTVPTEWQGETVHLVQARLNLDRKTYHLDYNRKKLPALLRKYGHGVSVFMMEPEGIFTVTSVMEDRTVAEIEAEFELQDLRHYLDQALRDRAMRLGPSEGAMQEQPMRSRQ